jgi:uncharacterized protein YndB with AHSA1/START domain
MTEVRLAKFIGAPQDRVFDAWIDPDVVARWMLPGPLEAAVEIEPRVGGAYRVTHRSADRVLGGFEAEIIELVRPKYLRWLWGLVGGEGGLRYDSTLEVTLAPDAGGTLLTLVHGRLDEFAAAHPDIASQVAHGWELVLGKLETEVSESGAGGNERRGKPAHEHDVPSQRVGPIAAGGYQAVGEE